MDKIFELAKKRLQKRIAQQIDDWLLSGRTVQFVSDKHAEYTAHCWIRDEHYEAIAALMIKGTLPLPKYSTEQLAKIICDHHVSMHGEDTVVWGTDEDEIDGWAEFVEWMSEQE